MAQYSVFTLGPEKLHSNQSLSDHPMRSSKLSRGHTKLNLLNQLWAYQA